MMVGLFFFFNDTATTEIYTLSLHDALPICMLDMPWGPMSGELSQDTCELNMYCMRVMMVGGTATICRIRW